MCTVSVITQTEGVLITMNRDEYRSRSEAPQAHSSEHYIFPVDAASGGTWCSLHRSGYAFTLLNRYESEQSYVGTDSRGLIIPELLKLDTYTAISAFFRAPNLYRFSPFDLLWLKRDSLTQFTWNGEECRCSEHRLSSAPFIFTSSSERTSEVIEYRKGLFQSFTAENAEPSAEEILMRFHGVRDSEHPRDGIRVDRPEVHTKSICQIRIAESSATFKYWPESEIAKGLKFNRQDAPPVHRVFGQKVELEG